MGRTAAWIPSDWIDVQTIILVTGPPAAGKSTLATALAEQLGFPVVDKDVIKEALFDQLGTGDREWSLSLSQASLDVMLRLAQNFEAGIFAGNFSLETAPGLAELSSPPIEVFCRCPTDELVRRIKSRKRHAGHLDDQTAREVARGVPSSEPLALGGPVLEVDTSREVDVARVVDWIRTAGL